MNFKERQEIILESIDFPIMEGIDYSIFRIIKEKDINKLAKENDKLASKIINDIKKLLPGCNILKGSSEIRKISLDEDGNQYDARRPLINLNDDKNKKIIKDIMKEKRYLNRNKFISKELFSKINGFKKTTNKNYQKGNDVIIAIEGNFIVLLTMGIVLYDK